MLRIEKTVLPSPEQWEIVIEGMRNPMNSWDMSDSVICKCGDGFKDCLAEVACTRQDDFREDVICIGEADHKLMTSLNKGGTEHSKYRRMLPVWVTLSAPLYFWKEADTYAFKVQNSCSTMHKIHAKEFDLDDFSHEHLGYAEIGMLDCLVEALNYHRDKFIKTKDKTYWWQMIQLLPTSYNQKRTLFLNYEVLAKMYRERKNHKLDEWHVFCDWIKTLPYSELITMEE